MTKLWLKLKKNLGKRLKLNALGIKKIVESSTGAYPSLFIPVEHSETIKHIEQ